MVAVRFLRGGMLVSGKSSRVVCKTGKGGTGGRFELLRSYWIRDKHARRHTHTHTRLYTQTCIRMHAYAFTLAPFHPPTHTHTRTHHTHTHARTPHARTHIQTRARTHAFTCTQTRTYTHARAIFTIGKPLYVRTCACVRACVRASVRACVRARAPQAYPTLSTHWHQAFRVRCCGLK